MKNALKIYMYFPVKDMHKEPTNPYVYTLVDYLSMKYKNIEFAYREDIFWTDEIMEYDIIHIMWPDPLISNEKDASTLIQQLQRIKGNKKTIICTCHNLVPHYTNSTQRRDAYVIAYQFADIFIHLGEYSRDVLIQKYPEAKHVIIPHHVYDTVYPKLYSKEEALRKLNYKNRKYAISLGAFRDKEEKNLFMQIADEFRKYGIYCIAPSLLVLPHGRITRQWITKRIKLLLLKLKHPNVITNIGYVYDEQIPYYYALSSISIIQRLEILNSGNVPLGMYFGNVILGPNVGNVNDILAKTGNPRFDVNNLKSIPNACAKANKLLSKNKGILNREYALSNWKTEYIAEQLYEMYKSVNVV